MKFFDLRIEINQQPYELVNKPLPDLVLFMRKAILHYPEDSIRTIKIEVYQREKP